MLTLFLLFSMTTSQILLKRINKELTDLEKQPRPGITCYPVEDNITQLEAFIEGPPESPYEKGLFKLSVQIPDRYPFEPPQIKFITRIYHPNIDDGGRICADILKTGDKGGWKPSINIGTALMSLRQLIAVPNPDDPLEVDIAQEFKLEYPQFERKAKEFTKKYATGEDTSNVEELSTPSSAPIPNLKSESESFVMLEHVEEKPKKFLSLSKKKLSSSSSQSSASQSSKQEEETKTLQINLDKLKSLSPPPKEVVHPVVILEKKETKIREPKKEEVHISLIEEEEEEKKKETPSEIIVEKKSTKLNLKKKSRVKEVSKKAVLDAVDNTKSTDEAQGVKRKASELDKDTIKENPDAKKCQLSRYPSDNSDSTSTTHSLLDDSSSSTTRNGELPKKEADISVLEKLNKEEAVVTDENISSTPEINAKDIASNAINIITNSMATYSEAGTSSSNEIGSGNFIELSDDEDDQVFRRPMYHSFSPKNPLKSKISLSRKKR